MTEYILYAWGFYYFIKKVNNRGFRANWFNYVKGVGLFISGKAVAIFLNSLSSGDTDISKVDAFFAIPLILFSIYKIAKLLNKRDETKDKRLNVP